MEIGKGGFRSFRRSYLLPSSMTARNERSWKIVTPRRFEECITAIANQRSAQTWVRESPPERRLTLKTFPHNSALTSEKENNQSMKA
jgi:hypothetical protein